MSKVYSYISNLKELLNSTISENPTRENLISFINLCHKTAAAYLRTKEKNDSFAKNHFGLTIKDIAWDSIAEIFLRDEKGVFICLTEYFYNNNYKQKTEEESWILLRRLIFSIVNQHIYRLNKIYDPALGKIIRNIKLHLKNNSTLVLSEFLGISVIHLKDYDLYNNHLQGIPPEFMEKEFFSRTKNISGIPDLLNIFSIIFSETKDYRKSFPLIEAAILIRKAFTVNNIIISQFDDSELISDDELEQFIGESIKNTEKKIESYIKKGKFDVHLASKYHKTIEEILRKNFTDNGNEESYFTIIKNYLPGLTKEIYLTEHREIIEYLAKTAKDRLRALLKKEFISR